MLIILLLLNKNIVISRNKKAHTYIGKFILISQTSSYFKKQVRILYLFCIYASARYSFFEKKQHTINKGSTWKEKQERKQNFQHFTTNWKHFPLVILIGIQSGNLSTWNSRKSGKKYSIQTNMLIMVADLIIARISWWNQQLWCLWQMWHIWDTVSTTLWMQMAICSSPVLPILSWIVWHLKKEMKC